MSAFELWGDREKVAADPIRELLDLYVRYHDEVETNPSLDEQARIRFKKLEDGDPEAKAMWTWFRDVSWEEFARIYRLLGVEFEEVLGESFYNDQLESVVEEAFASGLAEWGEIEARAESEEGPKAMEKVALIHLDAHGIDTPLLIQKSDGTSLYATRDLATVRYRVETWHPEIIVYVVGQEQKLYFQQVFKAAQLLGHEANCVHVPFGLIRLPKGKMSTRKGRVIFLEDVLDEAIGRAEAWRSKTPPPTRVQSGW